MSPLPSGVVTFCFTDIEGSTRLNQRLAGRFDVLISQHDALIRRVFSKHGGAVVKSLGDGLFAAFGDAAEALVAVWEAQVAIGTHDWPDGVTVAVRIGLHTGEAAPREGDYSALAVHQAARVAGTGHGGQIVLSEATALAAEPLPAGLSLHDLGSFRLRDFPEAAPLFQLAGAGLGDTFPSLRALPAAAHNVPTTPTSFVGREAELEALADLFEEHRLVTVVGPGGVGKTRLAYEYTRLQANRFPDGAWVALLADSTDAAKVDVRVADALGARDQPGRSLADTLVERLSDRRLLLVLDNCEHVVEGVAQLAERLLGDCAGLHVLATSREPLRLPGEQVWRMPPLAIPGPNVRDPSDCLRFEAVALFCERARTANPGFELDAGSLPAVVEVCRRVEGLPLALELAAARLRHMSVSQLADRLGDRLRLLSGGSRTAPSRHQTVRSLLDWSYELLSEEERALFRRLGAFRSTFTLDSAEVVCADPLLSAEALVEVLGNLIDKSLVAPTDLLLDEPGYRMLALVREYARDLLEESGELESLRSRHLTWVLEATAEVPLRPGQHAIRAADIDGMRTLHDDLEVALAFAVERGNSDAALTLAARFTRFAFVDGRWGEGRSWAALALRSSGGSPSLRASVLYGAGLLSLFLQDAASGESLATEALEICQAQGDSAFIPYTLHVIADAARLAGDLDLSRRRYEEAIAASRSPSHTRVLKRSLGMVLAVEDDLEPAVRFLGEVLAEFELEGDDFETARTSMELGALLLRMGRIEEARVIAKAAWQPVRRLGSALRTIEVLALTTAVSVGLGRFEQAARVLGATESAAGDLGIPASEALADVSALEREFPRCIADLRDELGEEAFLSFVAAGLARSMNDDLSDLLDAEVGVVPPVAGSSAE